MSELRLGGMIRGFGKLGKRESGWKIAIQVETEIKRGILGVQKTGCVREEGR